MLFMHGPGYKVSIRGQHKAAQLCIESHIPQTGGHQNFLIGLADALTNHGDVVFRLIRVIGNAHTAGEVDKGDAAAGFLL